LKVDIEIICIGNELLIGKIKDTNAHYLSKKSTKLGGNVKRVTVIQDNTEEIASSICEALSRKPQYIITTGGLGPTFDDKTLQGIAKALNRKLEVNQQALGMVKQKCIDYAKKRQMLTEIELTPPRVKMATLPEKSDPVSNPIGTAPGIRVDLEETMLFALPGVPVEMEAIFNETIAPLIKQTAGNNMFCERSLFVDNLMESSLAPLIDKVMSDNEQVYVKSHPIRTENKPYTELHLTVISSQEDNPVEILEKAADQFVALIEAKGGVIKIQ